MWTAIFQLKNVSDKPQKYKKLWTTLPGPALFMAGVFFSIMAIESDFPV